MKIGDNIKNLRELKNYTQAYMAERLGMTTSGYSKIEKNKSDITISKIAAIAEILETEVSSILNFDAKQVFYQTHNTNSVITGYNTTQNINGNIETALTRIEDNIQAIKMELKRSE
jgi:transcriptional regulator with XRE-family HTH domain